MIECVYTIKSNTSISDDVFAMQLQGDTSAITAPGQFINIAIDSLFLRRPISVCDWDGDGLKIIYKVVGKGTEALSGMQAEETLEALTGLGNGFDTSICPDNTCVIGGGVGVPPMYGLAKKLISEGKRVTAVLGFNKSEEIFMAEDFQDLGCETVITTADGSAGIKGFVTDALVDLDFQHFCACGPEPMLKAILKATDKPGLVSLEERMGCGFGACMGCSCKTILGYKRVCKEGPVFDRRELLW